MMRSPPSGNSPAPRHKQSAGGSRLAWAHLLSSSLQSVWVSETWTVSEVASPSPAPSPLPARQIPTDTDILPRQPQPALPDRPASAPPFPSHYSEVTGRIKRALAKLHDKDVVPRPEDTAESGLPPVLRPQPNVSQVTQRSAGTCFTIPAAQVGSPSAIHLPTGPSVF